MVAVATPAPAQRDRALHRANTIRLGRANLMRYMAALGPAQSRAYAASLLDAPRLNVYLETMPALAFLCRIRRFGRSRALGVLARAQVSELRPLGMLTVRQRGVLARLLRDGVLL